MIEERFIGKGLVFPIEITPGGGPLMTSGPKLINSSIKMILGWNYMQRIFQSNFGSRCTNMLEEPNDLTLRQLIEHFAFDAITFWEPRITLTDVTAYRTEETKLKLRISYKVKNSGLEHTYIFPFYREIA